MAETAAPDDKRPSSLALNTITIGLILISVALAVDDVAVRLGAIGAFGALVVGFWLVPMAR